MFPKYDYKLGSIKIKSTPKASVWKCKFQRSTLYIENFSLNTTENDLHKLFELNAIYLIQNCSVKISRNSNTKNRNCLAYVTAPQNIITDLKKI